MKEYIKNTNWWRFFVIVISTYFAIASSEYGIENGLGIAVVFWLIYNMSYQSAIRDQELIKK